jgi:hypothetical protein
MLVTLAAQAAPVVKVASKSSRPTLSSRMPSSNELFHYVAVLLENKQLEVLFARLIGERNHSRAPSSGLGGCVTEIRHKFSAG